MNNSDVMVSIIVPAYNVQEYIEKCIISIINQTYKNTEIIVVDDGSTDSTGMIVDTFLATDSRIKVIHSTNKGAGFARNMGLELANGKYISFVDADDRVAPDYIEKMYKSITDADLAICMYDNILELEHYCNDKTTIETIDRLMVFKYIFDLDSNDKACHGYLWNKLFKKNIIDSINLRFTCEYKMWEDMLFCCKYAAEINTAVYVNKSLYHYNISNVNSISHNLSCNVMQSWVRAAEDIAQVLNSSQLYDDINYNKILSDIYMKYMIICTKENKTIQSDKYDFLLEHRKLLRRKYRFYLNLFRIGAGPLFRDKYFFNI